MSENEYMYSGLAHKEGYDFSKLTPEKQKLSCKLYGGHDMMWDLYEARNTCYNILYQNTIYYLKESWGFPASGVYSGYILSCNRIRKRYKLEYVMDVLINSEEIKHVKFDLSLDNPIYKALRCRFNMGLGNPIELNECIGRPIYLQIENVTTKNNSPFSVLKKAMILSELQTETVWEMFDLMLEQTEACEDEGG